MTTFADELKAERTEVKPTTETALWVTWIPTGRGQVQDEGAVVGTEWVCRKRAEGWLRANPEFVGVVKMAPIPSRNICDATLDLGGEIDVSREF